LRIQILKPSRRSLQWLHLDFHEQARCLLVKVKGLFPLVLIGKSTARFARSIKTSALNIVRLLKDDGSGSPDLKFHRLHQNSLFAGIALSNYAGFDSTCAVLLP